MSDQHLRILCDFIVSKENDPEYTPFREKLRKLLEFYCPYTDHASDKRSDIYCPPYTVEVHVYVIMKGKYKKMRPGKNRIVEVKFRMNVLNGKKPLRYQDLKLLPLASVYEKMTLGERVRNSISYEWVFQLLRDSYRRSEWGGKWQDYKQDLLRNDKISTFPKFGNYIEYINFNVQVLHNLLIIDKTDEKISKRHPLTWNWNFPNVDQGSEDDENWGGELLGQYSEDDDDENEMWLFPKQARPRRDMPFQDKQKKQRVILPVGHDDDEEEDDDDDEEEEEDDDDEEEEDDDDDEEEDDDDEEEEDDDDEEEEDDDDDEDDDYDDEDHDEEDRD